MATTSIRNFFSLPLNLPLSINQNKQDLCRNVLESFIIEVLNKIKILTHHGRNGENKI
jgi:hypothetical protein